MISSLEDARQALVRVRMILLRMLESQSLLALAAGTRLRPAAAEPVAVSPFTERLQYFRRGLWTRRAALVLVRAVLLNLCVLLAVEIGHRLLFQQLSQVPILLLGTALLAAAAWLAYAQRPTIAETARLLDCRFRLCDQLGTAVEIGAQVTPGSLAARQVRRAEMELGRVPEHPWSVALLSGRARLLLVVLGAGMLTVLLTAPAAHNRAAATAVGARRAAHQPSVPHVTPQQRLQAVHAASLTHVTPRRQSQVRAAPPPVSFATSLQMRPGPKTSTGLNGSGSAVPLDTLNTTLTGKASQTDGTALSTNVSGARPVPSTSKGGTAQGQAASSTAQQRTGGGGGTGLGSPVAQQSKGQSATQSTKSAAAGQPGGTSQQPGPPQSQSPARQGVPAPNQPTGTNPFGQDTTHGSGSAAATTNPAVHSTTTQPSTRSQAHTGGAGQESTTGAARTQGRDGTLASGSGRGGSTDTTGAGQKQPVVGQAGAATGPQIDLGGHLAVGSGGQGSSLVRVSPLSAPALSAQAGAVTLGPSTVQGYVPENGTQLSPEEQALVRAYFAQGSP